MVRDFESGGTPQKHQVVDELRHRHTIQELCSYLRISRSGYYRYIQRKNRPDRDAELKNRIQAIYKQREGIYGYRRIQAELERQYGLLVNHKRVFRIMRELGLKSKIRKKRYQVQGYVPPTCGRTAENLLNRDFSATAPNQKWVTDVTYIHVGQKRMFLSVIMDLFNNEIVAYQISERNDNPLVMKTVRKAVQKRKDVYGTILHSDRGFQYTSHKYHDTLCKGGLLASMSRKGNCLDNACVESFFSHLKTEALYPYHISDLKEAQKRIRAYIRFYNEKRIQLKLNKLTPVEYRHQLAA